MKRELRCLGMFFVCAVLAFSATGIYAAAISASQAQIDWASLSITGNVVWTTLYSSSTASAQSSLGDDDDSQFESGWVDTSAYASVLPTYGNAHTSDTDLYADASGAATPAVMWAYSDGTGSRSGYFTATSSGTIIISIDYELWQQLLTDYAGELAQGYAAAKLSLWNRSTSARIDKIPALENEVADGGCLNDSQQDTLTVSLWFNAGDSGYFESRAVVWTYVETIPEPATMVLFSLGVLSLIRRQQ